MIEDHVNKRNGVASLIQIQAASSMDTDYLYAKNATERNPLFYATYEQPTRFDREPIMIPIESTTGSNFIHVFDGTMSDMIGCFGLQIHIPRIYRSRQPLQYADDFVWKNDIGHALIDSISIVNGDEEIAYFTGEYLNIMHKLDTSSSKLRGVNEMISHHNSKFSLRNKSRKLYVDVPFLKVGEEVQYFPLINTILSSFKMVVKFKPIRNLIQACHEIYEEHVHIRLQVVNGAIVCSMTPSDPSVDAFPEHQLRINLMYDSIHLTHEERNLFLTNRTNILFQTVQYRQTDIIENVQGNKSTYKMQLDFAHKISELIVVLHNTQEGSFTFVPLEDITVHLHGVDIKNRIVTNRYDNKHLRIPSYPIYVIPFCMSATTNQPTGTFSFDTTNILTRKFYPQDHQRLFFEQPSNEPTTYTNENMYKKNEIKITIDRNVVVPNCVLKVFAKSYNVLRIRNKTISLGYL